jgi:putative colanic acid biosysnthesis UDP-glucose lipid carrier transferase
MALRWGAMSEFTKVSVSKKEVKETKSIDARIPKPKWLSRKVLADMSLLYDMAAIIFSAWVSYYVYLLHYLEDNIDSKGYFLIVLIVASLFYVIARQRGQYDQQMDFRFTSQIATLIYVCPITIASAFSVVFFLKIQTEFSRVWVLLWMGILFAFLAVGRALLSHYVDVLMRTGILRRSVALVGSGNQFSAAKAVLAAEANNFKIVGALELSAPDALSPFDCARLKEELRPFIMDAQEKEVDGVVIALPSSMGLELENVMAQVQMLPVDVQVFPDFGGANISPQHIQKIGDASVITTVSKPITEWGAFLKRIEDFVIGTVCLVLALPAMVVIAIAVKLDSEGPIFFRQRRHGYNHRVIEVLKFRTMRVLEDGDSVRQATKNDSRITRVGSFLRRTSLDELPQFWNVIRGEMSVVGPRPHAIAHNTHYGKLIEKYANRHRVKPGITGWAQVHGFRGETTNPEMMAQRIGYDLAYIENWSIWLDLKIVIMTPLFGLFRRSAY